MLDSDGSLVLTRHTKFTLRKKETQEIRDSSENLIAITKREGDPRFSDVIWMEDANGQEVFRSETPTIGNYTEEIYDNKGNVVAQVTATKSLLRIGDPWSLKVLDLSTNRLLLFGFFYAMMMSSDPSSPAGS